MSVVRTVGPIRAALEAQCEVEVVGIAPPDGGSLAVWRQLGLCREAARCGAHVLHSFTSAFSLAAPMPVVQTVHEAPWRHGVTENAGAVHRAWVRLGRARAAATCTPSAGVARDLAPHGKLHVVPWGVDPSFGPTRDETDERLRAALPELPEQPFVLALGATRPKKRLELTCAGAERVGVPVVATGVVTPAVLALVDRFPLLILTGEIQGDLLPALVRSAGCVSVLSTSEGFALPVLEALRSGRAVITSAGTVQSETAGRAAINVTAGDADDVARGIRQALALSGERLRVGREIADGYSWSGTAAALAQLWGTLV